MMSVRVDDDSSGSATEAMAERAALGRRRAVFATLVLLTYLAALLAMARLLAVNGVGRVDIVLLGCFAAMLPWNVIGFWNAVIGFGLLAFARDPTGEVFPRAAPSRNEPLAARLALVMPVRNEVPARVVGH